MSLLLLVTLPVLATCVSFFMKKVKVLSGIAIFVSAIELFLAVFVLYSFGQAPVSFSSILSVDAFGVILVLLVTMISLFVSWYSAGYMQVEVAKGIIGLRRVRQYFCLFHLFLASMLFAISTTNPILMWIAIEATTLSTALLISFYNTPRTIEAAWKFLIINSVGLLLAFLGTLFFLSIVSHVGEMGLVTWQDLISQAHTFNPFLAKIAFVFVLIGYGTKIGLVPFHTWKPDAYSCAPIPVVALFSSALLNIAFLALLRFKTITDIALGKSFTQELLIGFGIISVLFAALNIFTQKNYKRILAYSSIEHAGIIAIGFGFGGLAAFAALLHMIYHALAKTMLFLSFGNVFLKCSSTKLMNIKGMLRVVPTTSILFIIAFLAVTGVPPFGIFITEFSILSVGIAMHPVVTIMLLLGIVLVFVGFLRHVIAAFFGPNERQLPEGELGIWTLAPIVLLACILFIVSIFLPSSIGALIQSATSIY